MKIPDSLNEEVIPVIVKWWADLLRAKLPFNNGASGANQMPRVDIMQRVTELRQANLKPEHADAFEVTLEKAVREQMPKGFSGFQAGLFVDYHPTGLLRRALADAGVPDPDDILPVKVDMHVYPTGIRIHAPHIETEHRQQVIWEAYDRVPIDQVDIVEFKRKYIEDVHEKEGVLGFVAIEPGFEARRTALVLRGIVRDELMNEKTFIDEVSYGFQSCGNIGFVAALKTPDMKSMERISKYRIPGVPPGMPDPWA